jgi:hypothetical protein
MSCGGVAVAAAGVNPFPHRIYRTGKGSVCAGNIVNASRKGALEPDGWATRGRAVGGVQPFDCHRDNEGSFQSVACKTLGKFVGAARRGADYSEGQCVRPARLDDRCGTEEPLL